MFSPKRHALFAALLLSFAPGCLTDSETGEPIDDVDTEAAESGPRQYCPPGEVWTCYSAHWETSGVGVCERGVKTCLPDGSGYGPCIGEITPSAEVCGDGLDNDCDWTTDEDCSACVPTPEVCGDDLDNDCDGVADDGCVCVPGDGHACYDGPPGTEGVGLCESGTVVCNPDGMGYGACIGAVTPVAEVCGDGRDNDCDGSADEGCCAAVPEVCGDGIDNDCDGRVDEGCLGNRVWNDRDRDGIQDPGEAGLGGATLILRTGTGALLSVAVSATSGTYWFTNIPAGSYYIEVIPPFSYTLSPTDAGGDDTTDTDFDGDTASTPIFSFGGNLDDTWDAGFYFVINT